MRASTGVRFSFGILVGCVVVLTSTAGCSKKKPKAPGCDGNSDCAAGQVCVNRQCVECATSSDCSDGKQCRGGACVAECAQDADCPSGTACLSGRCQACTSNDECGPGGTCEAGACKRATACTTDDECADDEDCTGGLCLKPNSSAASDTCQLGTIYFALDSDAIAGAERDRLTANAACVEKTPAKTLLLIGHTDSTGTEEYNIALSERRGQSVADYLSRLGIDPARMQIVPKGETEPTGRGDDQDRRVEFGWQ